MTVGTLWVVLWPMRIDCWSTTCSVERCSGAELVIMASDWDPFISFFFFFYGKSSRKFKGVMYRQGSVGLVSV